MVVVFPSLSDADTRLVRKGENLQAVLNAAVPGDVIELEAGAEFAGNFVLPVKSGEQAIVIRSSAAGALPGEGTRIRPVDAPHLARLRSKNAAPALETAPGSHHWVLQYLEFAGNLNGYGDIIQIGDGSSAQDTLAKIPHHFVLAHLYVHGHPLYGQKRCVSLNAAHVTIRDSHISDCKGVGVDTQAIGGWNGPGPYTIDNNYLEATGENVLFGGADPAITNMMAEGVVFRRNHVTRPFAWRNPIIPTPEGVSARPMTGGRLAPGVYGYRVVARRSVGQGTTGRSTASAEARATVATQGGAIHVTWEPVPNAAEYRVHGRTVGGQKVYWTVTTTSFVDTGAGGSSGAVPSTSGTVWSVKNLFELKAARNVAVLDNVFENHWQESQPGYAIVLTPRNPGDNCPLCTVQDVRFENNVVRHVSAGINLLGQDSQARPTVLAQGIVFRNNLFHDVSAAYGGNGWFMQIGGGPRDVVIDHNTISHSGSAIVYAYGGTSSAPSQALGFRFTNNAVRHNAYGINGPFFSYGTGILNGFFPDAVVTGNFIAGAPGSRYPSGNRTAGTFDLQFVDESGGDYRLLGESQLRGAAIDGGDIGADMGTLLNSVANVEPGLPAGSWVSPPANVRLVQH